LVSVAKIDWVQALKAEPVSHFGTVRKFNPNHAANGEFASADGSGGVNLSADQINAVDDQLRDPSFVNETLRGYRGEAGLTSEQKKHVELLDAAIAESEPLPEKTTLYRAVNEAAFNGDGYKSTQPTDGLKPGSEFTDPAYVSTSTDKKSVLNPGYTPAAERMVLIIAAPKGARTLQPSKVDFNNPKANELAGWEHEHLLPRGQKFRIDKVDGKNIYCTWLVEDTKKIDWSTVLKAEPAIDCNFCWVLHSSTPQRLVG
jgi:hypothetical protein